MPGVPSETAQAYPELWMTFSDSWDSAGILWDLEIQNGTHLLYNVYAHTLQPNYSECVHGHNTIEPIGMLTGSRNDLLQNNGIEEQGLARGHNENCRMVVFRDDLKRQFETI